jgi:hypothetical protein
VPSQLPGGVLSHHLPGETVRARRLVAVAWHDVVLVQSIAVSAYDEPVAEALTVVPTSRCTQDFERATAVLRRRQ